MTDNSSNIAYVHGNVGIGTTQAAYTLDVDGDIRATGNLLIEGLTTTVDTQNLSIEDAIVEIGRGNDGGVSGKDVGFLFTRNNGADTTNSNVALIYDESTDRLTFGYSDGSPTDSTLAINTSKSLDVVIPSGNLGVGTDSPLSTVDISSTTGLILRNTAIKTAVDDRVGYIEFHNGSAVSGNMSSAIEACVNVGGVNNNTDLRFKTTFDYNNPLVERMRIDRAGNVGIGKTNPISRLDVSDLSNSKTTPTLTLNHNGVFDYASPNPSVWQSIDFTTEAGGTRTRQCGINLLNYSSAGSGQNGIADRMRTGLGFSVHNENGMVENALVINKDGNVGIGTVSPGAKLHLVVPDIGNTTEVLRLENGDGTGDIVSTSGGFIGMHLRDNNVGGGEVARISWKHDGTDSSTEGLGQLGFWTSNTGGSGPGVPVERMTIRANGNVGIGTTNPTAQLTLGASSGSQIAVTDNTRLLSNTHYINYTSSTATDVEQVLLQFDTGGTEGADQSEYAGYIDVEMVAQRTTSGYYGPEIFTARVNYIVGWNEYDNLWRFTTFVQENKSVSAGVPDAFTVFKSVPVFKYKYVDRQLQIYVSFNANLFRGYTSFTARVTSDAPADVTMPGPDALMASGTVGTAEIGMCYGYGAYAANVGIGTTNPSFPLDVVFSGDSGIRAKSTSGHASLNLDSDSGYGYIRFQDSGTETVWLQGKPNGDFVIRPQGTDETVSFAANGNVGIGTATPYAKLHVHGSGGTISSASRSYFRYGYTGVDTNTNNWGGSGIYSFNSIVTGDYFVSHSGTIGASDTRIKKNIVDANDAECLETLRLLKPKKYQYKDEINRGQEPVWGFIAQEVRETLPYATQLRKDVLPNIYELANVSQSNVITFTNFNTSNLESNATTLIRTKGIDGEDHDIHLAEVIDEHTIRVEEDLSAWTGSVDETGNVITEITTTTLSPEEYEALEDKSGYVANITGYQNANVVISVDEYNALEDTTGYEEVVQDYTKTTTTYPGTQLFVYGQEVDDFVFLKKEAIWTVATSALQEVDRQLQAEKAKVATLETQLASVLARLDALESA
jgi:hypothetical protein